MIQNNNFSLIYLSIMVDTFKPVTYNIYINRPPKENKMKITKHEKQNTKAIINVNVEGYEFSIEPRNGILHGLFCLWSQKNGLYRIRHEGFITSRQMKDQNYINELIEYALKTMQSTYIEMGYEEPERNYTEILTEESTGDAYNNCQCDDNWFDFQVFIIEAEQVIGITSTWPIAITEQEGALHSFKSDPRKWEPAAEGVSDEYREPKRLALLIKAIDKAINEAKIRGWKLANWAQE